MKMLAQTQEQDKDLYFWLASGTLLFSLYTHPSSDSQITALIWVAMVTILVVMGWSRHASYDTKTVSPALAY